MRGTIVTFLVLLAPLASQSSGDCPRHADCGKGTCCPNAYSVSGYGCCPGSGLRCCVANRAPPGSFWPPPSTFCCPVNSTCVPGPPQGPFGDYGPPPVNHCRLPNGVEVEAVLSCKAGVPQKMSEELPNVLVLGDSVSIGNTIFTTSMLAMEAKVQHTPWDYSDGGAEDVVHGMACLEYWTKTADFRELHPPPAALVFGFGLHDLWNYIAYSGDVEDGLTIYTLGLEAVVATLRKALPTTKLGFMTTTPVPYNSTQNDLVVTMNTRARAVMEARGIPIADLYATVVEGCGHPVFYECLFSLNSLLHPSPHYTPAGCVYLSNHTLVPFIRRLLSSGD